ncbi:MAG: Ldh family oxidoreductase [Pseudomonadota bacterium]
MKKTAATVPAVARYPAAGLQRWTAAVFARCGVPAADAALAARVLVRTSLRGIDTHGVGRVPPYLEKLRSGEVRAAGRPRCEKRAGALVCDGDLALGQVVVPAALAAAVALARQQAVVGCTISHTGHLAALGGLVLEAAEQGFVAVLCQQTSPVIALPGALGRAIGNNPLAFAMPVAGGPPLVFDMANSVVARGNVHDAVREGRETLPEGWAIGPDGQPTTDPRTALAGAMLPVGGHKGIGLAMLVECLAGSLGGVVRREPTGAQGSGSDAGAFLLVVNPALLCGTEAFDAQVQGWLATYLAAAGPQGRYPGQRQAACEAQRLVQGIPVPEGMRLDLCKAGEAVGAPFDVAPIAG